MNHSVLQENFEMFSPGICQEIADFIFESAVNSMLIVKLFGKLIDLEGG